MKHVFRQRQTFETESVPLSRSPIWELQRRYFAQAGIEAWRQSIVPSFITSNPFIAHGYAQLLLGYLTDLGRSSRRSPREPVNVIELGAGSGRFAYFLLKQLFDRGPEAAMPPIRYVMTDISRGNLQFWREHERFRPFVASGVLDFARFDPARDETVKLETSGGHLGAGSGPMAVIANYVFDSVEQDVFRVEGGRLHEGRVRLRPRAETAKAPAALDEVALSYDFTPCRDDYYDDPEWNAILSDYARTSPDGAFSFPVAALRMLANLRRLSGNRLLLLAADKAMLELQDLHGRPPPQPVGHGSISFTVNFHALAAWTRRQGALALTPGRTTPSIAVLGLLFGDEQVASAATEAAYDTHIRQFGPGDFFQLRRQILNSIDALDLPEILALLRLARGDPATLQRCYDRIVALLATSTRKQRHDLRRLLLTAWEHYLPLQEDADVAFQIGSLLAGAGFPADAARFLRESLATYGEDPVTLSNLARCEEAVTTNCRARHACAST